MESLSSIKRLPLSKIILFRRKMKEIGMSGIKQRLTTTLCGLGFFRLFRSILCKCRNPVSHQKTGKQAKKYPFYYFFLFHLI